METRNSHYVSENILLFSAHSYVLSKSYQPQEFFVYGHLGMKMGMGKRISLRCLEQGQEGAPCMGQVNSTGAMGG